MTLEAETFQFCGRASCDAIEAIELPLFNLTVYQLLAYSDVLHSIQTVIHVFYCLFHFILLLLIWKLCVRFLDVCIIPLVDIDQKFDSIVSRATLTLATTSLRNITTKFNNEEEKEEDYQLKRRRRHKNFPSTFLAALKTRLLDDRDSIIQKYRISAAAAPTNVVQYYFKNSTYRVKWSLIITSALVFYLLPASNDNHHQQYFGGVRQASAAMTITQTLRYLRNFGYLYDSINHKDFDFNGGPLPAFASEQQQQRQQQQPVNLRHSGRRRGASTAALHFQSTHLNYDNSTNNNFVDQNNYDGDAISSAIRRFQAFSSLPVTGQIDSRTLKQLRKPRCGNIDLQPNRAKNYLNTRVTAGMPANYILQGSKWDRTDLTFKIGQYSRTLSRKAVDEVIGEAFSYWSNASKLTFRQIHYGPADIIILFAKGEHGDLSPFDGPQGVLAHAFFPDFGGDTHFDDAERWTHGRKRGVNLLQVAVHELGHALGLDHSDVSQAVMAPFYDGFNSKFQLHADDIKGIRRLYGPPPEIAVVTATKSPQNTSSTTSAPPTTTVAPATTSTASTTVAAKMPAATITTSSSTTATPIEDVVGGVTRQQHIDDEILPAFEDIAPPSAPPPSLDSLNSTALDADFSLELQNLSTSTTTTTARSVTEAPNSTLTTTTFNSAWWWPPIEAADKTTDSKSTLLKQQSNENNSSLPFFGTPFDDIWQKKPLHTVKGKRINSNANRISPTTSTTTTAFNSNQISPTNAIFSRDSNEQSNTTAITTQSPASSPEEWSLFGFEDLTLQVAPGTRKRLHVHKTSLVDAPSSSSATTLPTALPTAQNSQPDSYEGIAPNASLHIDLCDPSFRIDAVTTIDGVGYMFAGDAYWRVSPMGEVLQPARSILADWRTSGSSTVPTHIDAALSPTWAQGRTYLFKGNKYWRVSHGESKTLHGADRGGTGATRRQFFIEDGYPKLINTGWAGIPDNIESAFQWGRSTRTYFTKGNEIWSFDRTQVPPVRGPKTMPIERGFPGRIDAAFRSPSGRTYLFAGDKYYAMSTWSFLISRYYPQLTSERWFGCRPATPSPFDNNSQHHNFNNDMDNNSTTLIITPHAAGDIAQINYSPSSPPDDYSNVTFAPTVADILFVTAQPTDNSRISADRTTTEAGHFHWHHSRNSAESTGTNHSANSTTPVIRSRIRDTFVPTQASTQESPVASSAGSGEFVWQSSSLPHSAMQYSSNLETLMSHAMAAESAAHHRQPNRTFRNPTNRQVRFQPQTAGDRAATSLSMAETNAVALSSRRVAASFGARQFYNHLQQRSKRSSSNNTTIRARQTVFYLRREKKLFPLP